jgi:hypothetical protein
VALADAVQGANRSRALAAAESAHQAKTLAEAIGTQRDVVNFEYWRDRCEFERTEDAVAARQNIYEAEKALADSDFELAGKKYDAGLQKWRAVLDAFPGLLRQDLVTEDLQEMIDRYQQYLSHEDKELPADFILRDVMAVEIPGRPVRLPPSSSGGDSKPSAETKAAPAGDAVPNDDGSGDPGGQEQPENPSSPASDGTGQVDD